MHQKCWLNNIITDRETFRILLRLLDSEGVDLRSRNRLRRRVYHSRGPNYVWHIDGYDKIKPFGIAISGCIDGFSRKMLWLEAYKTNNDPKVIAGYFMDAVVTAGGCPARVRFDLRTENSLFSWLSMRTEMDILMALFSWLSIAMVLTRCLQLLLNKCSYVSHIRLVFTPPKALFT